MARQVILYPSLEEALELHNYLIDRFGGKSGVRDMGLLESALFRPQTGYYDDIVEQAAALLESLISNHPFFDGNKRMAFFLTDIFLRMNGWKVKTGATPGHRFIIDVIKNSEDRYQHLLKWLQKHLVKLS